MAAVDSARKREMRPSDDCRFHRALQELVAAKDGFYDLFRETNEETIEDATAEGLRAVLSLQAAARRYQDAWDAARAVLGASGD
jgi:hypothetical protein